MLQADEIEALGTEAEQLFDPLIRWLLADICKRVAAAGQFTATAQYEIWKLQNLGVSQQEAKQKIAQMLNKSMEETEKLLTQSAEVGYNFDLSGLPNSEAIPFQENEVMQQIVNAAVSMARGGLENITQTMGFVTESGVWSPLYDAYIKACDSAFMKVSTGATSYTQALREATAGLRKSGITCIDYNSGKHYSVEAAVRRNVFSAMGIMQEKISQSVHDDSGCDGWEISAHAASAPDHEPIQGKQYSDEAYRNLNNSLIRRIGTLHCGHAAFPIVLGVSKPQYSEKELDQFRKENEEGFEYGGKHYTRYEATQRQRQLERAIRKNRENILMDEALGDAEQLQTDQIREVRLEEEYKRFSEEAGLKLQHERMEMAGYGPKQAMAAEKTVKNQAEAKMIEEQRQKELLAKYENLRYNPDGTIIVTDDWTQKDHPRIPKTYKPNAVIETLSQKGKQKDRTIFDNEGKQIKQVSNGPHGNPKQHPFGNNGEHAHDIKWEDGKIVSREARELTDQERKEHADIL